MKEVIILAGGKGERLRPLTEDRPKAMVEILGSPILGYQLRWLHSYGFRRVLISCGYLHEVIRNHFGNGSHWGLEIEYLVETEPLGRGGGIKRGLERVQDTSSPVLAINGDIITNTDLNALFDYHERQNARATIVTVPMKSPYGIVQIGSDGSVEAFAEKPTLPVFINAGVYVLDPSIVDLFPDQGDHEDFTFPTLANRGQLKAFTTNAFWKAVDTVKDLGEVRSELEKMLLGAFLLKPAARIA